MTRSNHPIRVVGLSTSPRLEGNSDLLLQAVLEGARHQGAETQPIWVGHGRLGPCTACHSCRTTGSCKIPDEFQPTMTQILSADRLVFATPVFFAGVCAQAKLLIDRCQTYWVRHHLLGQAPPRDPRQHAASLVAVGREVEEEQEQFQCLQRTARAFFDALGFGPAPDLYVGGLVDRGDVVAHPTALAQARDLGRLLVENTATALRELAQHAS